jgi:hypothetical protein
MPTSQDRGRRRRLATTTLLAVLTVAALAAGASGAGAAPTAGASGRSVSVQDPADVPDPRVDLRAATAAVSRDGRFVTVTATLAEPTDPTSVYWWRGYSLPRPGIAWGFNVDSTSPSWSWVYRAELRGDPVLGPYGYVAHEPGDSPDQVTCRVTPSFDGASYRMRFPVRCIGSPARVRFGVYVQLYDETGTDILGGDIAPGWEEVSDWLVLR